MLHSETLWLNKSYVTDYVYSERGIYLDHYLQLVA